MLSYINKISQFDFMFQICLHSLISGELLISSSGVHPPGAHICLLKNE